MQTGHEAEMRPDSRAELPFTATTKAGMYDQISTVRRNAEWDSILGNGYRNEIA